MDSLNLEFRLDNDILVVRIPGGRSVRAETDAAVTLSPNVHVSSTSSNWGEAISRKFLSGESFFQQVLKSIEGVAEVSLAPKYLGDINIYNAASQPDVAPLFMAAGAYLASDEVVEVKTRRQSLASGLFGGAGLWVVETKGTSFPFSRSVATLLLFGWDCQTMPFGVQTASPSPATSYRHAVCHASHCRADLMYALLMTSSPPACSAQVLDQLHLQGLEAASNGNLGRGRVRSPSETSHVEPCVPTVARARWWFVCWFAALELAACDSAQDLQRKRAFINNFSSMLALTFSAPPHLLSRRTINGERHAD